MTGATTRAVVTGAGSGLGRALAKALAARGATVVVSDVREDGLRATAEAIAAAGGTSHVVLCDVSIPGDVERLATEAERRHALEHRALRVEVKQPHTAEQEAETKEDHRERERRTFNEPRCQPGHHQDHGDEGEAGEYFMHERYLPDRSTGSPALIQSCLPSA